jgi:hypothetical protein
MEERDYEAEAKEQGWNPDFDGPNKTDAKTFVERGEQIAGILKSKNAKLEDRLHRLEEANQKFGEYHKKTIEAEKRRNKETIAELESRLEQAITNGDGQEYTRTQREIDQIKASESDYPTDDMAAWNAMTERWVAENPWYNQSRKMARFADGVSDEVRAQGYNGAAYFAELTRQVKEEFPEEFKNPNKSAAAAVENSGEKGGTSTSKKHTYDSLPADAKRACDEFTRSGFMTKEDYVANYEWDE